MQVYVVHNVYNVNVNNVMLLLDPGMFYHCLIMAPRTSAAGICIYFNFNAREREGPSCIAVQIAICRCCNVIVPAAHLLR